jgi:hypothetical protein
VPRAYAPHPTTGYPGAGHPDPAVRLPAAFSELRALIGAAHRTGALDRLPETARDGAIVKAVVAQEAAGPPKPVPRSLVEVRGEALAIFRANLDLLPPSRRPRAKGVRIWTRAGRARRRRRSPRVSHARSGSTRPTANRGSLTPIT